MRIHPSATRFWQNYTLALAIAIGGSIVSCSGCGGAGDIPENEPIFPDPIVIQDPTQKPEEPKTIMPVPCTQNPKACT